jgi:cytochrome c-type biogenesis protein CcmF
MALAQLALGWLATRPAQAALGRAIAPVAVVQAVFVSLSFACLIAVFARSDMSVLLVAANSHSAKPMIYKISGTWGNHEGSMLLWVTILALAGATIALFERKLRADTKMATLAAQAAIALGFYAFLLFASNPFARIAGVVEGQGLNPLLQDPGLAFHPPTLYAGYVGMSAAFCSPAMSGRNLPAPCGRGFWAPGCCLPLASSPGHIGPITHSAGADGGSGIRWKMPA